MTDLIKTNEYSGSIHRLTDEKLGEYIDYPENFHDEAVLAALWELANRRPLRKIELSLENKITERLKSREVKKIEIYKPDFRSEDSDLPFLYSIKSIQLFSVLFSVLAGGILMAINFKKTSHKAEAVKVIGFSLSYTLVSLLIFTLIGTPSFFLSIILNLLGAFLIDELFWKRVLGLNFSFKKQQFWSALVIALILISPLIWYVIKNGAELLQNQI